MFRPFWNTNGAGRGASDCKRAQCLFDEQYDDGATSVERKTEAAQARDAKQGRRDAGVRMSFATLQFRRFLEAHPIGPRIRTCKGCSRPGIGSHNVACKALRKAWTENVKAGASTPA